MLRNRNKLKTAEIIEYRSKMRWKIDANMAGVQGMSNIYVQSVCSLITRLIIAQGQTQTFAPKGRMKLFQVQIHLGMSNNTPDTFL